MTGHTARTRRSARRSAAVRMGAAMLAGAFAVAACHASDDVTLGPTGTPRPDSVSTTTTSPVMTLDDPSPGAGDAGDPYFPGLGNGGYDVRSYDLAIDWFPDDGTIDATATIELVPTQALSSFHLDLVGFEVGSIRVDGVLAPFGRDDRELFVKPETVLGSGTPATVVVTYRGVPEPVTLGTDVFRLGWIIDGRDAYVVSEPAGAATWFPSNDHPTDKATFRFAVTVPSDLGVVANGVLRSTRPDELGRTTWVYESSDLMATYLASVVIGDLSFDESVGPTGLPIRNAYPSRLADAGRAAFADTGRIVDALDDWFGPYPFEVYGQVVVDEDLGFALENQTLSLFGSGFVTGAGSGVPPDVVIAHELAHQWFGDAVSVSSWRDIWLSEGFATYAEWVWRQLSGGPSIEVSARDAHAIADFGVPPGDPGPAELFQPTVYLRGGLALYALSREIGDEAFRRLLPEWVARHGGATASTADLRSLAEELSGRDLGDFFDRWVYGEALPPLP